MKRFVRSIAALLCTGFLFAACGTEGGGGGFDRDGKPNLSNPEYVRPTAEVRLAKYEGVDVYTYNGDRGSAELDVTNISQGYVVASCNTSQSGAYLVIQYQDGSTNQEVLSTNGSYNVYNFTYGSGSYTVTLYIQAQGSEYTPVIQESLQVTLADEFSPFLVQTKTVDYDANSNAIRLSQELIQNCSTNLEAAQMIYYYIAHNISYDDAKAASSNELIDYVPNIDSTLSTGTGICYDYAALAAAMLRANGIPTRLIKGYVSTGEDGGTQYHAWNEIWCEEDGWVAYKVSIKANQYNRIDLTFAAAADSTTSAQFIGDGNNYMQSTVH